MDQTHLWEVDVETSGNAMLMYLLHKNKKLAHEKRMVEKTLRGWVGVTNWGVRLFIYGGDSAQGG